VFFGRAEERDVLADHLWGGRKEAWRGREELR